MLDVFLDTHKVGFRLLKMIHRTDPSIIPLRLLRILFSLLQTFGSLFLSSELIDALIARDVRGALGFAALLLALQMFLGILNSYLHWRLTGDNTKLWLLFHTWLRQKAFQLDYESMESAEVTQKILFLENTSDMKGGLGVLFVHYSDLLQAFLQLVTSLAMVVYLCFSRGNGENAWLEVLTKPSASVCLLGGAVAGMLLVSGRITKRYQEKKDYFFGSHTGVEQKLNYLLKNVFQNQSAGKMIRIFGMEKMLIKNMKTECRRTMDYYGEMMNVDFGEGFLKKCVSSLFSWLSYLFVILKVLAGAVSIGSFTKYVGAINQFSDACGKLVDSQTRLRQQCSYMKEFLVFLDRESGHVQGSIPVEKRADGEYELAFENVSFKYPGSDIYVLRNVNCKLNMKKKMAVVGRNGAGKTTFIKLLCRFYEPTEGRITLNGVDIRKYKEEEYRDLFGVVFQDFKLFSFSVGENIAAGYPRQEEELWKALEQAGISERIKEMPEGLDTILFRDRNGVDISGGEAQKLALARALYKDAPVVILDEPTAALDPVSEAALYADFEEMVKDKTSIYISHRMSSCRFCDDIIVFDQGRIAERGSHEELMEERGQYAAMWQAQARYYV